MKVQDHTYVKRKYNSSTKDFLEYLSNNPHPNLPVIVEVTDDYYVMEYVYGKTLYDIVEDSVISQEVAKKYILQLLDAVEVMHGFKIVHRDIKPENIVIKEDGTLKLIDFDISRKIVENKNSDTDFLGTAGYAAPEQYGFTQTDERSDIYSIGIVYNYMITGKKPMEQTADGQIGKIIKKCTKIDNKDRYKTIKILRKDIKRDRFTSYKFLDVVPGFRTRNPFKMFAAIYFYFCWIVSFTFILQYLIEDGELTVIESIVAVALYFLGAVPGYAIITNLGGFADYIKFPIKNPFFKKVILVMILYVIWLVFSISTSNEIKESLVMNPVVGPFFIAVYLFYDMIKSIISGML